MIDYSYDALSRVLSADYADNSRRYDYLYDLAGNRLQESVTIGITTTVTDWTYDDANRVNTMQVASNPVDTFGYDANGNLLSAGGHSYEWNHAGRMTQLDTGSGIYHYEYDGDNNRLSQRLGTTVTEYLLDTQAGLAEVLRESDGTTTNHYVHGVRGVQALEQTNTWTLLLQDGLGSVRAQVDNTSQVDARQHHSPYGQAFGQSGTWEGSFGYAGEQIDPTGLSYNRARYYDPTMGMFTALDPFEGMMSEPMSMNGYSYVDNNPIIRTDPSGANWRDGARDLLESAYFAWQNTFVESGWSQAVRDNPGKALLVSVGSLALVVGSGGTLSAPVAGVLVAGVGGASAGGAIGVGYAEAMYHITMSGQCGCDAVQGIKAIGDKNDFVSYALTSGMINGAFFSQLAATGPLGQITAGGIGVGEGAQGVAGAVSNAQEYGADVCDLINGLLGVAGVLGGVSQINTGYNQINSASGSDRVNIPVEFEEGYDTPSRPNMIPVLTSERATMLVRETRARALTIAETQTKSQRGPVLSGVHEPATNTIYFGQNHDTIPARLHPIIENRIRTYNQSGLAQQAPDYLGAPGAHSEIYALNDALWARQTALGRPVTASELPQLMLHNVWLWNNRLATGVIRCVNCNYITNGVTVIE